MNSVEPAPTRLCLERLQKKIPYILAAPKTKGNVRLMCIRPTEGTRRFVDEITFDPVQGILGDRWFKKTWMYLPDGQPDPRVQVCILQERVLDLIWHDRETIPYPGDNLIVDMDLSEENLPTGIRLQAGSAVLEVSDVFNTGCHKFHARYGPVALHWVNRRENTPYRLRGILCQVISPGVMHKSDQLRRL